MLKQRLLTVAVILPLLLGLIFLAPNWLWSLATLAAMPVASVEWARLSRFGPAATWAFAVATTGLCAALLAYALAAASPAGEALLLQAVCALATLFWLTAVPAWLHFRWQVRSRALLGALGVILLVPLWLALVYLQRVPVLLLTLGVVWIADTAAYFAGHAFGKRKLAPEISPGKTVEGVVGAYAAVLCYGLLVSLLAQPKAEAADHVAVLAFIGILTALSVGGDLFESWMKRQSGLKDSGQLLPGHGGLLGRIDSLTAAMPFAALYLSGLLA